MFSKTLQAILIPVEDWASCHAQAPDDIKDKVIEDKVLFLFLVANSPFH